MSDQPAETPEKELRDLVEQMRSRLLALKKARIVGSKLASIVSQLLPAGRTFRDLLPEDVDRETATFRVFAERRLETIVTPSTARRGADLLYDIVNSGQEIEPEPGDLWRAFVSVSPKHQLILDCPELSLRAVEPPGTGSPTHLTIEPVLLSEHKGTCIAYSDQLRLQQIEVPHLGEILQDYNAASYTKWLKALRTYTPPLDRDWGVFRKKTLLEIFKERLRLLGFQGEQLTQIVSQFASDAPKIADAPGQAVEMPQEVVSNETAEAQARRRLHLIVDKMTLEQMNSLMLPFGLFSTDVR